MVRKYGHYNINENGYNINLLIVIYTLWLFNIAIENGPAINLHL